MEKDFSNNRRLRYLEALAKLMDSQFNVPGTTFRFGLDPIMGLIPGVGDFSTFAISAFMIFVMAKNGASGFVLARMILNVLIDTIIGAIPLVGDLFDFAYKSNTKNIKLMREYYVEGRHRGGAWKVVVPVLILFMLIFAGLIWLIYKLVVFVSHLFS